MTLFIKFVLTMMAIFFLAGIGVAIDGLFLPDLDGYGVISGKTYSSAYVTGYTNPAMRGGDCRPERCGLKIDIGSGTGHFIVNKELWMEKRIGDEVRVTYQQGRFSGCVIIISVDDLSLY